MRRKIGFIILALALAGITRQAQAQKTDERQQDRFTFLHISDTYQTASAGAQPLATLVAEVERMTPAPAFVVHTGDITSAGHADEYTRAQEALRPLETAKIEFYAIPGNRDIRWSPDGKESFLNAFGKAGQRSAKSGALTSYQSFDVHGTHFILLDSTVALQHWGHLDTAQLQWLERDLKRVKAGTPILIFLHHEVGREETNTRPIANEFEFWPLLNGRNVIAIFTAQGKADSITKKNGITIISEHGLNQRLYHRVTVTPLLITVERLTLGSADKPAILASLPVSSRARPSALRVGWDDDNNPYLIRRHPAAMLEPRSITDNPDGEKAECRIDEGDWNPMTKDARDIWRHPFVTTGLPNGVQTAAIRLTTSNKIVHEGELIFEVERGDEEPTRKWATNLDGPIQSSPLLQGKTLYASSLDNRLYALNTDNGKKRWNFAAKGAFLASPVLANGVLYVGSTDHFLYALDAENGKFRWKYDTGSPIFATAAVTSGIVCIGGSGKIYGLEADTGKLRWTQNAGSFFQSHAAADERAFYLGGWDNTLYALDALTGTPRWTAKMGRDPEETLSPFLSPAVASPAVNGNRVYICSLDGVLHALDSQSGKEIWAVRAPEGGAAFGASTPIAVGVSLFVAGTGGQYTNGKGDVYALDTATGRTLWHSQTGQAIADSSARVAPDGKSLAIIGVRGRVSILNTTNGKRLWGYELGPGNVFSTPAYDGSIVYTATMANDVQAINSPGIGILPSHRRTQ